MPQDLESPLERKKGRPIGSLTKLGSFYENSPVSSKAEASPVSVKAEASPGSLKAEASPGSSKAEASPVSVSMNAEASPTLATEVAPLRLEADFVFETGEVPMLGGCCW